MLVDSLETDENKRIDHSKCKISLREKCLSGIFTCSHYIYYGLFFLFFCVGSEGMNAIVFRRDKGRGQKSTTYSENISVIKFYLSTLTLHLLWSIIFISVFGSRRNECNSLLGKRRREVGEDCGLF